MADYSKLIKNLVEPSSNHSNRGMSLESEINDSNKFYNENDIALIEKRATPINIAKYDRSNNKITLAYFDKHSTTDYCGLYKGHYIDFEAKETSSKTSFNLNNIKDFQYEHLKRVVSHGGIAFFIICFTEFNEYYLIFIDDFDKFLSENPNKKSIPYDQIKNYSYQIDRTLMPPLDYLSLVDKYL